MTYVIKENSQYNSREVYFTGKPSEEVRTALKSLKMRWNPSKVCWYGFAAESAIISAICRAEENSTEGATVYTDGYMGGGARYGSKSDRALYGSDLSAAIRADIKAAGLKGVTIRCKEYSGGQSIAATVTINSEDIRQDYTADTNEIYTDLFSTGVYNGSRWVYGSEIGEQEPGGYGLIIDRDGEAFKNLVAQVSAYTRGKYSEEQSLNQYHLDRPEFTEAFAKKLHKVRAIIDNFRYNSSNSMVDYFDTNFYYTIYTKPGKGWK